jgi:hypothetical protein
LHRVYQKLGIKGRFALAVRTGNLPSQPRRGRLRPPDQPHHWHSDNVTKALPQAQAPDRCRPWPAMPKRCAPSCWQAPPRPL